MSRDAASFECSACGQVSGKWLGRCPSCGGWNTFEAVPEQRRPAERPGRAVPTPISAAGLLDFPRLSSGIPGFDRVLGGGFVGGSVVLLAGEPGVGKSTLLLQVAALMAAGGPVLYLSAEESNRQVALRASRLGCIRDDLALLAEPVVELAIEAVRRVRPRLVIADSVQTMLSDRIPAVAGSVTQVREVASQLLELAKRDGPTVVLVGHVTKEGTVAGPKSLEHVVDVLLEFSGGSAHAYRGLRATKNRFGPAMELALFQMTDHGLEEVVNPSAALLSDRRLGAPGSAVAAVIEGSTPLLVEVQALVSRSALVNPRRIAQGVDGGRLALLLAVLERHAGLRLADRDVFVNVVGGVTVDEPAIDLAVAGAVLSAAGGAPLPADLVLFGELGLLGEVRGVARSEERVKEAGALGFRRCALAATAMTAPRTDVTLVTLERIGDLARLLDEEPQQDEP
jgi:DNA repair protein RadA/Sms